MKFICLTGLLLLNSLAFSASVDPEVTVNAHNNLRNLLNQGALGTQPVPNPFISDMYWDELLAESAQAHSDQCIWQHSGTGGENLYAHTGDGGSMEKGIKFWAEEYQSYSYEDNASIDGKMVGHYTQMVWDDSLRVGCAKTLCNPILYPDGSTLWPGTMYTCHYRASGNWVGQKPYSIVGTPTETVDFIANNLNLQLQLLNVGGLVFRLKMDVKTFEPPVFEIIAFDQVHNIDLSQYPDMAYFDGQSIIIPKLTIDGSGSYRLELKYIGELDFQITKVQVNP